MILMSFSIFHLTREGSSFLFFLFTSSVAIQYCLVFRVIDTTYRYTLAIVLLGKQNGICSCLQWIYMGVFGGINGQMYLQIVAVQLQAKIEAYTRGQLLLCITDTYGILTSASFKHQGDVYVVVLDVEATHLFYFFLCQKFGIWEKLCVLSI